MGALKEKKPVVKRHGSFILRDGWINKALAELAKEGNEKVFSSFEATDIFGIGSNMVTALKYWITCFNLVEINTQKGIFLSELGKLVYLNDSYLEDMFTIWILHSNIVRNREKATLFSSYFTDSNITSVTKEQLVKIYHKEWEAFEIPVKSIESDVTVLFNMYCREKVNDDPEDKIISPLNELGLLSLNKGIYKKVQPDLRTISDFVILYEISNIFEKEYRYRKIENDQRSLSIDKIANGKYGLGNIYNLSRIATNQMLNRLQNLEYIKVDRTAGLDTVYDMGIPKPIDIIREYYRQR